jgi:hypothetical protein
MSEGSQKRKAGDKNSGLTVAYLGKGYPMPGSQEI